jgi:hypothetical protein
VTGILLGSVINLTIPWFLYFGTPAGERVGFIWLGIPGWTAAAIALVIFSGRGARSETELRGLTWQSVRPERKDLE